MEVPLFEKIIRQLESCPVENIFIGGFGENLLHKNFAEILQIARSAGINLSMSTNGQLLSEIMSHHIVDTLDLLVISYESQDPKVYEEIRKGGDLSLLEKNVERFLQIKGKRRPVTVIQSLEFPNQPSSKTALLERWQEYDVIIASRPAHDWLGDSEEISTMSFSANSTDLGVCDQPWRHVNVFWDGGISPCCNFYDAQVVFGNLNDTPLREIWNGEEATAFRQLHVTRSRDQIPQCRDCKLKEPGLAEKAGLMLLDIATINRVLFGTDGWRE